MLSKFIWNGKRPRVHLSTLQRHKLLGALAVPNFEFHYWSFQIRTLSTWVNPEASISWKMIESAKAHHIGYKDLLFSKIHAKILNNNSIFGPIIANFIQEFETVVLLQPSVLN